MLGKPSYEHVLAKTRGLFSYQSNSLEIEKDKITAHRAQRRVNCGWASSVHKPYRPLGTPDVIDKRKFHLLKQSFARAQAVSDSNTKKGANMALNSLNGGAENAFGALDEDEDLSSFDLKTEIKNSNIRRIGCRSGASFKDVLSKQSPKSAEALPKIVSRINESGAFSSSQENASPSGKTTLPLVPSPSKAITPGKRGIQRPDQSLSPLSPSKLPSVPVDLSKMPQLSSELLTLDPSTSMSNRLDEFRQVKTKMNENLAKKLHSLSEERFETYKRKLQSFKTHHHTFSTERWKLEAERVKIEARLNALNMHKWYFSFIQFFDSMTRHTPAEKVIISQVKYVIEGGYEYDYKDFQRLIALLPKRAFKMTSVLQILNNLRNELEIGDDQYLKCLRSCDITVPSWSISKGRRR